ncbi:MAG: hypothetical protein HQK81_01120 [Desulfovibrionaceae bacterium]|nr:hypothetical protein [Desulfovibrionaceae bacterium]MBF0512649.1 hypothetical protein [Desulfovibrionaceae bacterium]
MKRLIVGPIPDDFDPDSDIAAGPGCFLGREDVFPGWEELSFPVRAFQNDADFEAAAAMTAAFADSLAREYVPYFNEQSGTGHSWIFWRLMAMPWLVCLVQTAYDRQLLALGLVARYGDAALEVDLLDDRFPRRYLDCGAFADGTLDPWYNWWVLSRVLEKILPPAWSVRRITAPEPPAPEFVPPARIVRKGLGRFVNDRRCTWLYGCDARDRTIFGALLALRSLLRLRPKRPVRSGPAGVPAGEPARIDWVLDFDRLLRLTMPETLKNVSRLATEDIAAKPGSANLAGPDFYFVEWLKYRMACKAEGGERIICTQHGGGYGALRTMSFPHIMEYRQDAFVTWGWKEHGGYPGRFVPLPSPLLSKIANAHREKNDKLLFVATGQTAFRVRLDTMADNVAFLLDYRASQRRFFTSIRGDIRENVLYRPYFSFDAYFDDAGHIKKHFPDLQHHRGDLHAALQDCKLLALDNLGTTFYLAMAADTPTVAFWNPLFLRMYPQAEKSFEALRRAGIVAHGPDEAVLRINAIWDDVGGWWRSPEVRRARKKWLAEHARASKIWRFAWAWEILKRG